MDRPTCPETPNTARSVLTIDNTTDREQLEPGGGQLGGPAARDGGSPWARRLTSAGSCGRTV